MKIQRRFGVFVVVAMLSVAAIVKADLIPVTKAKFQEYEQKAKKSNGSDLVATIAKGAKLVRQPGGKYAVSIAPQNVGIGIDFLNKKKKAIGFDAKLLLAGQHQSGQQRMSFAPPSGTDSVRVHIVYLGQGTADLVNAPKLLAWSLKSASG